ncbi:DNA polymerase III subunit delta' [Shewanella sp. D64]|uniref:DNA polymerase III subunit delta' n=1 Tax=unclassified Shewanella TaxID=196818 RepID=UPI0022BA5143|nr:MULTISPECIES: DNA polymerase III subunit delta' [unclassified Shewanella]MEC4724854.1 DNA polymerase III subunit delta' [Shewanella sp. D64]MEC4736352.1 DNA polymerase III subunit delta' [Shewanella sp. E94]WBJ97588.1 DNA polymerase III subunit delta' [Shewanella sp. MTB7]
MLDIPWLKPIVKDFCVQLQSQHVGHAYLIGVHIGYGGESLTLAMAKAALCQALTIEGACGFCKGCQLIEANNHPDFYHVVADGNQIKVDQIRELCQKLTSTSQQGGRRVVVISQCEKLNLAAANALLKTLEEPGKETLLLLQSNTPSRLMATINSRCQRVHFQSPSTDEIKTWLGQSLEVSSDVTWCLPVMGGPLELASALQDQRYEHLLQLRKDWTQSLSSGHLCANLININEKQVSDAIKVLYLILRQKLVKQTQLDALLRVKVSALAAKIMNTYHKLSVMPNVNSLALFQGFILEYKTLT